MVIKVSFLLVVFVNLTLAIREGRLVGGSVAAQGQFPHNAALFKSTDGSFLCNGFIINEYWIGTTAFCIMDLTSNQINVQLGSNSLSTGAFIYTISQIAIHESFVPSIHLNDIAAIRTLNHIAFNERVRPIALGAVLVNPGATVTISGWGKTSHLHTEVSDTLNFLQLQVLTNADCQARLTAMGHNPGVVFDVNFCTFNGIGQGTCYGDMGSPIIMGNQVVGINSWDEFCGLGSPDINVRMSSFRSWFLSVTQITED